MINFGKIDSVILFGGGNLLVEIAFILKNKNIPLTVFTSSWQGAEFLPSQNMEFKKVLSKNKMNYVITKNINKEPKILNYINKHVLGISLSACWIFRKNIIEKFNGRLVNLHGTNLPMNAGGGGFSWAILMGNRFGCSTLHLIDENIDTGAILKQKEYSFPNTCRIPKNYITVSFRHQKKFLEEFINDIINQNDFIAKKQNQLSSTYWPRISTDIQGYIDWNLPAKDLEKFICAFDEPYQGASTYLKKERVYLKGCTIDEAAANFHPFQWGLVYRKYNKKLFVAVNSGTLIIDIIEDGEGKNMYNRISLGDRLFTPIERIEQAKSTRASYS